MPDNTLRQRLAEHNEQLLGTLYGSALSNGQWTPFLKRMIDLTGSRSARLLLLNQGANTVQRSIKVNIDDSAHQRYVEHFVNLCPWRTELGEKPAGQLYSTYLDFSCRQPTFYQSEFFNDWAKGLDIHHGVCGTVYSTEQHKVQLLIQRTGGQGHYSRQETNLINSVLPHVRQALRLSALMADREARLTSALSAAQMHPLPFILFNANGQIRYFSPQLEQVTPTGLRFTADGIELTDPNLNQQFKAALHRLTRKAAHCQTLEWRVEVPRAHCPPLYCLLAPVFPGADPNLPFWQTDIHAALYIRDPLAQTGKRHQQLMSTYGLTDAEARLAQDIALGLELKAIAARDHRSIHTLRSQLKSIFNKTGRCRQSQLAALVNQLPAR
ncbi:helix-turn-helix transcriptional regulator [Marinimicrobium sp. C6131]|uniref:helix-turn-helix transcriptional regulator n=1 Tax=Marinimicrobium sp. C6131 TaxID=3022676 RepID=UPI00223CA6C7|nr:helix-turn-helix transcriptional regulator [Marinimicrobium sp. C6131]UZJ43456.1 helix-turn-helix transcriptional regulator [Marinimicrobium sp. C6131]